MASSSTATSRHQRGTPNPFFVTSSAAYGLDVAAAAAVLEQRRRQQEQEEKAAQAAQPTPATTSAASPSSGRPSFPFLYRRTSDEIGKDVPGAAIRTTAASSSSSSRSTAAASSAAAAPAAPAAPNQAVDPDAYLQGYRHQAKAEHPLYTTSQNALGARPPNRATVVTDRRPIPQAFTNSFNNQRYSDQSLNCAVTRSKVHKALDQFF